jgi:hypothetical protein
VDTVGDLGVHRALRFCDIRAERAKAGRSKALGCVFNPVLGSIHVMACCSDRRPLVLVPFWTFARHRTWNVGEQVLCGSKVPTVGEQLSNAPSDLAQKVTPPAERIFADATPADLHKLFEGKTDTQAQQQLSLYLRTWFKVSGSLHDLTENSVNLSEHMFPQSIYHLVMVFRDERWLVRLRTMPVGRRLTIIGEFVGANKLMIYLDNCELLEEEA